MKKIILLFFCGLFLTNYSSFSQLVTIANNPGTSGNAVIGGSTYHVQENIYTVAEIGAGNFETMGTAMTRIAFNLNTFTGVFPFSITNYEIYMKNAGTTSTYAAAGTYSLTGYTQVFNGTITFNGVGWNSVDLTTPFVRTAGQNLSLLLIRNNGAAFTGTNFYTANGNDQGSALLTSIRYNGTVAPVPNSTSLATTAFRVSVQLSRPLANDASVVAYVLGKIPQNLAHSVTALVTNLGTTAKTNLAVTLNVTGANPFTNIQTIPSLASGASTTVTFAPMATGTIGINTVTVSVPTDDDNANNTKILGNQVTAATYSTAYDTVTTLGVGSNTAPLDLAIIFRCPVATGLTSIKTNFSSSGQPYVIKIYSVNTDTPQNLLYTSPTLTTAAGPNTVTLSPTVGITGDFAVSINQTGITNMGCSYESETPQRLKTFYAKSPAGTNTWGPLGAPFKIMVDATLASGLVPVNLTTFTGVKEGGKNILNWSTANETNNKAFELQRSSNGEKFSSIATINSKAENGNSSSTLYYSYNDEKPLAGTNYYRLRQIDKDGKESYSSIVALKSISITKAEITRVYPNPVSEQLNIVLNTPISEKVNIRITDLVGKTIAEKMLQTNQGDNNIQFNTSNLNRGTYLIKIFSSNESEMSIQKFIKQ